jgi:hypothetical protein
VELSGRRWKKKKKKKKKEEEGEFQEGAGVPRKRAD